MGLSILRRSMWIGLRGLLNGRLLVHSGFVWGCKRSIGSFGLLFGEGPPPAKQESKTGEGRLVTIALRERQACRASLGARWR